MRILSRYVLREFLVPLVCCLVGFVSIYVLFELFGSFSRILQSKMSFGEVVLYFCAYIAPFFRYLAPAALLLATLYTMWMFCRHSEIVAMRASGISFIAIVKPVLSAAFVMALLVVWVNERFVPEKAQWARRVKDFKFDRDRLASTNSVMYANVNENRSWTVESLESEEGDVLAGVRITEYQESQGAAAGGDERKKKVTRIITSSKARFLDGEWWLENPQTLHYGSDVRKGVARGNEASTPVASPTPELDALPLRCYDYFGELPIDFRMQNRGSEFNSVRDRLRYLRTHPNLTEKERKEKLYDYLAQIMSPFACLIITLIAIPAGIASGRQSVFKGILGALGLFFAFYGVTIGLMVVCKNGFCPPVLAAVSPYVLFLALGLRAFWRVR